MYATQDRSSEAHPVYYAGAWLGYYKTLTKTGSRQAYTPSWNNIEDIQLPFDIVFAESADLEARRSTREVVGVFAVACVFGRLERSMLGRIRVRPHAVGQA